jgi:hypothetical protein
MTRTPTIIVTLKTVVLAKAGTQFLRDDSAKLDPRVREDDGFEASGALSGALYSAALKSASA